MIVRWIALLSVLLCSAGAPAQADMAKRVDAVKEFKKYFRKFKKVDQKVEAVRTLEGNECVPAAEELVKLFNHKMPEVVRASIDVLSGYKSEPTFRALIEELPEMKNQDRRAVLIDVLGRAGIKSASPVVCDIVVNQKLSHRGMKISSARTIGSLGGDTAADALAILIEDSDVTVRMAACDSVGQLDLDALGKTLVKKLEDPAWQVQLASVQALGKVREQSAVTPMIGMLRKGGRVVEACADSLFYITGIDLGTNADEWQKMWDRLSSIPGWRIPTDAELAKKAASRKRYDAIYGKTEKANSFSGIKTTSTRILFIIDISGSMEDLVVQKEQFDANYPNYQKLTIVKTELARTIDTLDGNTLFNIVAFASKTKPWKKFLVPANVVNRASAKNFVKKLKALGGKEAQGLAGAGLGGSANLSAGKTNTFAALMYPFGIDPEKKSQPKSGAASKNKLDTVFFLSDGRPSTGKIVDEREILRVVNETNREFRMTFHVIAIGEFQKGFLKHLAEANNGMFVDLGK